MLIMHYWAFLYVGLEDINVIIVIIIKAFIWVS